MVDTMEPQPLRAPELTIARNQLQERFDKVKKWHEEQQERLRSIQEIRQQKLQENTCQKFGGLELHKKHLTNDEVIPEEAIENGSTDKRLGGRTSKTNILQRNEEEKPIKTTVLAAGTSFEELMAQKLSHEDLQPESDEPYKPIKRPFLKKGAGLKRYYSKTPQWMQNKKRTSPKKRNQLAMQVKKPQHLITKLRLQREQFADSQHKRNDINENKIIFNVKDTVSSSDTQKYLVNNNIKQDKDTSVPSWNSDSDFMRQYQELEKQQHIESVELAEFEMLEEAAENTSFISECSLIADKARDDKPVLEEQTSTTDPDRTEFYKKDQNLADNENSVELLEENLTTQSTQLQRLLQAVKIRHQVLLNRIAETKIPINKELSIVEEEDFLVESDLENSSDDSLVELPASFSGTNHEATEDKDNSFNDIGSWKDSSHLDSAAMSEAEFDINVDNQPHQETDGKEEPEVMSKILDVSDSEKEDKIIPEQLVEQNNTEETKKRIAVGQNSIEPKQKIPNFPSTQNEIFLESTSLVAERYNIQKKTKELEDEIATFKKENESLILLRKQREQALQQLEKERKEIANYKEEIKKSLEEEVNEGRRQLYRERQNFERYQKIKKNYPDKKERELISALRQQVEKLQNDLKKLESKSSAECKRLKHRLSVVEKERDSLKITVKQLEAQRVELLTLLKESQGKKQQIKKAIVPLSYDELPQTSVIKNRSEDEQSSEKAESQAKILNENKNAGMQIVNNNIAKNANESSSNKKEIENKKTNEIQHSTIKNKTKVEYSSKTREESLEKINENHSCDNEQTIAELESTAKSVDETSKESSIPIENPDENNNGSSLATHLGHKKSILKKHQKVQFSEISDETTSSIDAKEKNHEQKEEKIYSNGDREITFPSGTRKHVSADGLTITINFYNGDWKQVLPDQRVIYHYAETDTTQTIYPDGSEIIEFSNGQIESHLPNGTKHIVLPDGSKCTFYTDGTKQTIKIDGTVINVYENGTEVVEYPNGQSEIRNQEYKKRKYPDGTVKILYVDGREETRYSNGRMRIKGKDGDLILDIQLPEL